MTKKEEAAIALEKVHQEQEISHEQTVRTDRELMEMIEKTKENYAVHKTK